METGRLNLDLIFIGISTSSKFLTYISESMITETKFPLFEGITQNSVFQMLTPFCFNYEKIIWEVLKN